VIFLEQHEKDQLVKRAYERYLVRRNPDTDSLALDTLKDFHSKINDWNDQSDLRTLLFTQDFLVGQHMEAISSSGSAAVPYEDFKKVMRKISTVTKIKELFTIRKTGPLDFSISNKILEANLINHVIDYPGWVGNRPKIYIQRFLLCIFIEIMTTIADDRQLRATARLLGMNPTNISFEKLQVQIRLSVDDSLDKLGIGQDLNLFSRAAIAYFIEEVSGN
jgi:hypothetical protein